MHGDQSRCATVDTEQLPMEPHRLLDRETAGKKTAGRLGNSSQVRPSSTLPVLFLFTPPHCLKWNATAAALHWSRIERTHSIRIGLAFGPLSPPRDRPINTFEI